MGLGRSARWEPAEQPRTHSSPHPSLLLCGFSGWVNAQQIQQLRGTAGPDSGLGGHQVGNLTCIFTLPGWVGCRKQERTTFCLQDLRDRVLGSGGTEVGLLVTWVSF